MLNKIRLQRYNKKCKYARIDVKKGERTSNFARKNAEIAHFCKKMLVFFGYVKKKQYLCTRF